MGLGTVAAISPALALSFGTCDLSIPFLALLALLVVPVAIWSLKGARSNDALMLVPFVASMLLVLVAQSVASFAASWEAVSLTSVFVVAAHHERRAVRRATFTYLVIAQAGALCVIAGLAVLAVSAGSTSFTKIADVATQLPTQARTACLMLALIGFGSKAGLMPLHFWLPRAHPVAPANASALLSGAMLKVALYGLLLVAFVLAAPVAAWWGYLLLSIAAASCVGGVLYAVVQHDLKVLLAYHSVENIGIILLAAGAAIVMQASGHAGLATLALAAALYHAVNHGIFKGLLFLGAGVVAEDAGTADLERLGGLATSLRWTAPLFLVGCAAICALPPFNGFISEWLTFRALIAGAAGGGLLTGGAMIISVAVLALTGGLASACFVKVYGVAFSGIPRGAALSIQPERFDVRVLGQTLLAALCLALGVACVPCFAALIHVANSLTGATFATASAFPPLMPIAVFALPLLGGVAALAVAAARGIRSEPAWTCGSPVAAGTSAHYTATAFAKPLRTIFGFALPTDRLRTVHTSVSPWFPSRIIYRTETRYVVDETVRRIAAYIQQFARRTRVVQSGRLRYYIGYAIAAFALAVLLAR